MSLSLPELTTSLTFLQFLENLIAEHDSVKQVVDKRLSDAVVQNYSSFGAC